MMNKFKYGKATCYSGYREGQSPHLKKYPSYEEVLEDLLLLEKEFKYIRLYDPSQHAVTTLRVIRENKINLKVMIGVDLRGEISNPDCSWGGEYTDQEIKNNIKSNYENIEQLIFLANEYKDIVFSVSAGNEAVPEWNENLVSPARILEIVKLLKKNVVQPVTYCENVHYWISILEDVAKEVDFISLHTYPAWQGYPIEDALKVSIADFNVVQHKYPDKYCVITEAGWPTKSGGKGIKSINVSEEKQFRYYSEITKWSEGSDSLVFFFEAFDEPWKGGENLNEPEKNWGLFKIDRTPKKAIS